MIGDQAERVFHRERLDVHRLRTEAAEIQRGDAQIDVLGTRRREQHIDHVRIVLDRSEHLEIEADFLDRVRDVLIRLDLDLRFHVLVGQVGRHRHDLGDDGRAGDGRRGKLRLGAGTGQGAADGLAYCLDFDDVFLDHSIRRQRLHRVVFYAIATANLNQLQQLDGC